MPYPIEDLQAFLNASPTSWHAAAQIGNRLALHDFSPLEEEEKWKLEPGGRYFVVKGGSLCAFRLPEKTPKRASLIAAHTDSPALKLRQRPEVQKDNMTLFSTEVYGSPLIASWLNRDLGIAGRVVVSGKEGQIEERLVFIDEAPLMIPQLAIHLSREVNEKGLVLNRQEHLCPLATLGGSAHYLEELLRRHLFFHQLLSHDLFLVPLEPSRLLGGQRELLASYRLDNLQSAHACVTALTAAKTPAPHAVQMAVFWDAEEIGSATAEGASSPFLSAIFSRIAAACKLNDEDLFRLKARALCLSVDVAHGLHPSYPQQHDPAHTPLLGKGVAIKYHAAQRYATNAVTAAEVVRLCQELNLNTQILTVRSDTSCGSTLGPIVAHTLGIATADIGCPLLSMHAPRELIACRDHLDLCQLLTRFLE
jgi:aspartyl aminopeptidase